MLEKIAQQSLLDSLLRIMPELRERLMMPHPNAKTNTAAAKALYSIWSKEANKVSGNRFRRPNEIGSGDVKLLETEGLVRTAGEHIEITSKGGHVIKQMILGDDRSSFEDNGKPIEYMKALANLKPNRQRKYGKVASVSEPMVPRNWYEVAKHGH